MNSVTRNPKRYKKILSRYYTGRCNIYIKEAVTDRETHKTRAKESLLYKNIPCRLSHESKAISSAYERNTVTQQVMLFLDNEIEIPAGAKIEVVQDGVRNLYGAAGEPNVFETHQQVELTLWEDYSGKGSKRTEEFF